jgi:hypothetical protein
MLAPARHRQDDAEVFEVQQSKAMEQPSWTEGRLDDLNKKVDGGIGRLDEERKELRTEAKEGFGKVDKRFDAMQRTLIASAASIIAAVIGAAAAIIVALIAVPLG